jgi:Rrf2 family protein
MRAGKTPDPADPAHRSLNSDFVILITFLGSWRHRPIPANFGQSTPKGKNPVTWPAFPKRLQSALKALCCLASSGQEMQSQVIAAQIAVPEAETAKILQLLVWGGFVTSRRGTKGGFQLATAPSQITMGEVIDFFLARHPVEPAGDFPVMRALEQTMAACQRKFAEMKLSEVADFPGGRQRQKSSTTQRFTPAKKSKSSSFRELKRRS